jgi:predicted nucleotidyltransferase
MEVQTTQTPRAASQELDQHAPSESVPTDLEEITGIVSDWCGEHPVQLCVVFGSQASGRTHPHSDVDLAVWPTFSLPPTDRLCWLRELETALGREVSLVLVSPALDPVVGFEIARQGRLVFEKEPGLWAAQRVRLWHVYEDSLPFRQAARQRLREFAEEVRRDA